MFSVPTLNHGGGVKFYGGTSGSPSVTEFYQGSTLSGTVSSAGAWTLNGNLTVSAAVATMVVKDTNGNFGTNSAPRIIFEDNATTNGTTVGYTNAAEKNFRIKLSDSNYSMLWNTNGTDQAQFNNGNWVLGSTAIGSKGHAVQINASNAGTAINTGGILDLVNSNTTAGNMNSVRGYNQAGAITANIDFVNVDNNSSGTQNGSINLNTAVAGTITTGIKIDNLANTLIKKDLTMNGAMNLNTVATATSYSALASDDYIGVTSTAAPRTITLPAASSVADGHVYFIKDESGGAGTSNITISRSGSDTIDGATSVVISVNYGVSRIIMRNTAWWTL